MKDGLIVIVIDHLDMLLSAGVLSFNFQVKLLVYRGFLSGDLKDVVMFFTMMFIEDQEGILIFVLQILDMIWLRIVMGARKML